MIGDTPVETVGTARKADAADAVGGSREGVADRAVASAGWMFAHRMSANVVRLAAVAVLARHLSPSEFGIVALAQVLLQFITLVGEAGIGTYVIYDEGDGHERRVHAAFWLNLALTVAQCALCAAALPLVAHVYGQPQLTPVLAALIAVFFMRQMAIVPEAVLQRGLRHPLIAKRDMLVGLLTAALSVVLALSGAGVWSLVVPSLVFEPSRCVIAAVAARWRPRLPMQRPEWRRILRYIAPLMGSNVLIPVTNDGDTLLVGKVLGAATVGYYNLAWQLANLVGRNITAVVSVVTLPALALVRSDLDRFRAGYLRMIRFLGFTCLPVLVGMALVAGDMVPVVYGRRWGPAITLFRIFVAFTLVRTLTSPSSMVYNVTGRPGIGFRIVAWMTPIYVAAIAVGTRWGAAGVATAVVVVRTVGALVELRLAGREIALRLRDVGRVLLPPAAITAAMAAAVTAAQGALVRAGLAPFTRLVAVSALGALTYMAVVLIVRPTGYDDLARSWRLVTTRLRRLRRRPRGARKTGETGEAGDAGAGPVLVGQGPV